MFMTLEEWSDCLYSPYNERPSSPSASSDISFYSGGRSPSSSSLGAGEGCFYICISLNTGIYTYFLFLIFYFF